MAKTLTQEHKRNISNSMKGKMPKNVIAGWNKGRKETRPEVIERMRKIHLGKRHSPNTEFKKGQLPWNTGTKGLVVAWNKGIPMTEEIKERISKTKTGVKRGWSYWKGKKMSVEHRMKLSKAHRGDKSYLWKGGVSKEYKHKTNTMAYKEWRKNVYERDNFTCQDCGLSGVYLTAHHIKSWTYFPELRYEVFNGRTLCESCHCKTDNYKGRGKKTKIASENSMRIAVATL